MKAFCPECGCDMFGLGPVLINDFSMLGSMEGLAYRGVLVPLTSQQKQLCWTLMKACPDPVRLDIIMDRLDSDGNSDMLRVLVHKVRKKLAAMGAPNPVCTVKGRGAYKAYSWLVDPRLETC